jgi:hypothetical protein
MIYLCMDRNNNYIGSIFEVFFGIFFSVLFLYLVNTYYTNATFLNDNFNIVLPFLNLSLIVGLISHIVNFLIRTRFVKKLSVIVNNLAFLLLLFQTYMFFPFDFSWSGIIKILIVLVGIGVTIGTFVETIQLFLIPSFRK